MNSEIGGRRSAQASIPLVIARAGTSRGLFLHARDLPPAGGARDRVLARLMGSPDALQVDGLGGARPITSKVAIVAPSQRDDADVDYTFAQVDIAGSGVGYEGNCGNISAGVGPFAIDEGLVPAQEGITRVRIYNTNTAKVLVASVPVQDGRAMVEGDYEVPGVPGTGAEIGMNWAATVGAKTGRLLPTGNPTDMITLADGRQIPASLVDAANPCVWVRGADFGLNGTESARQVNADKTLLEAIRDARAAAAVLFGFADDRTVADARSPGLPMLGLVSQPTDYRTINGADVRAADMDVRVHLIFLGSLHESIAGTGSICLAAASRIQGSTVFGLTRQTGQDVIRIGHPSGVTPAQVRARAVSERPFVHFEELGFSRTARRLMEGKAFFPVDLAGYSSAV